MKLTENDITRKMLNVLREENEVGSKQLPIKRNTPNFGDVRTAQEDTIRKTIGEGITFDDNSLIFYPNDRIENSDIQMNATIGSLNVKFQFKYRDSSGMGVYIWANGLQLTDANTRVIGKIHDAFVNWKQSLDENGDLFEHLYKASTSED
jgi:hypothetical protein